MASIEEMLSPISKPEYQQLGTAQNPIVIEDEEDTSRTRPIQRYYAILRPTISDKTRSVILREITYGTYNYPFERTQAPGPAVLAATDNVWGRYKPEIRAYRWESELPFDSWYVSFETESQRLVQDMLKMLGIHAVSLVRPGPDDFVGGYQVKEVRKVVGAGSLRRGVRSATL
ncbi:MAG: hypothetical protein M1828_004119 [Chrysothrix sp. TS-e1954]|nr:MAG: hypothetical protein M1828_004119 [Chrysothrix sp. TS-e1954]